MRSATSTLGEHVYSPGMLTAFAPGRVNLIGDHTDYTGGLVMPMAVQMGTTVRFEPGGDSVHLASEGFEGTVDVPIGVSDPASVEPRWGRYVAGVVLSIRPSTGGSGYVSTTLPVGAGLSSSAALEVALALALGFGRDSLSLARACRRAEQISSGLPCGIMDHLASAAGRTGHALLIDCTTEAVEPVAVPPDCEIVVVPSGETRHLASTPYADRHASCEEAARIIGPLAEARRSQLALISDPTLRRRARHVITENERVRAFAGAMASGDLLDAGRLMVESHRSLRDDFEVSTPALERVVERLLRHPGVYGTRLTGGGFGGCVVALTEPGSLHEGWTVVPSAGARVSSIQ